MFFVVDDDDDDDDDDYDDDESNSFPISRLLRHLFHRRKDCRFTLHLSPLL